ncbi:MAG: lipoyl(octanoyl) transferase LipB [Armatimonadota bacterium]
MEKPVIANNQNQHSTINKCFLYTLGRIGYQKALDMQHNLHNQTSSKQIPGALMLLEHDPVITMGVKSTSCGNLLADENILKSEGIEVISTDRGGDITYHGPGQLVGYPILALRSISRDLHTYLRDLEESIILLLAEYGLKGNRNGPAGVWVGNKKVCSIGVAVRKWTTYHGFALNICPNLDHFSYINPCGLKSSDITSISELLKKDISLDEVMNKYLASFEKIFGLSLIPYQGVNSEDSK